VAWHLSRTPAARHIADELTAAAQLAALEAARSYSAKHGTSRATWTRTNVDWAIRELIRVEARHRGLQESLTAALSWGAEVYEPSDEEKLQSLHDAETEADAKLRSVLRARAASAAVAIAVEVEEIAQSHLNPEEVAALRPLAVEMRRAREELAPRHKQLLSCVYDRRMSLHETAVELGLAYPTVKVLHGKILRGLYAALVARGFADLSMGPT
jgi:DNA-directed RNA polymerase specialized sigma subunit